MSTRSIRFESRNPEQAPILNEELLGIHARFSQPLAWIQATKYLNTDFDGNTGKTHVLIYRLVLTSHRKKHVDFLFA